MRQDSAGEVAAANELRRFYNERKLDVRPEGIFPMDTSIALTTQYPGQFRLGQSAGPNDQ
ncbi:MAG TPA: hypothetical protein PKE64_04835 [Anaerolineae bacterium]|nr:hypothetical protein [Anaerolineae bacterium]HMR63320.1 hypothetical protein [Anaerolineae bacterium]